ncbi:MULTISPECIES: hypothetical protein [unclassified Methylophaga]|jgi:hypothetical protein|uniref:hypothetical protein n=1 Tax=unclassified Methylophaga TaxID=2629249 RepID=UPI000C9625AC|nr:MULTISPECIES: hypothetical protein [unclassified Methylophaga]MAK68040.1 hypothetical protein [Methylophaga sp.]MAY16815.1 hypothetical protein [Methylophaga sp.]MBN46758.1 hypothetical protein [Methylophaga sp.]HAO26270.1 hypothetical protein [Methylophaga sp.]HCD05252.1 hypothetical protein [Methylophaga sp.]|tara:strand:- start:2202 stop:2618 length:417 start_codon:yes stop_codon:yes gene_type:complete
MKKLLLALPFIFAAQLALAIDEQDEKNYTTNYTTQLKPMVVQQLNAARPEMTATAVESEANAYVMRMASCQLNALKDFPEVYRDKAILPVAGGADLAQTTQNLNQTILQDIEADKLTKDQATRMIVTAQESVQICMNS